MTYPKSSRPKRRRNTSTLLINERVLMVQPSLVMAIGLNEALFLQQVHFWTSDGRGHERNGRIWVYNTYEGWQQQFPWWSPSNIRRLVSNLERDGYLISSTEMNAHRSDRTKWYAIDYDRIRKLEDELDGDETDHVQDPADGPHETAEGLSGSSHIDAQDSDASTTRQRKPKDEQVQPEMIELDPVRDRAVILGNRWKRPELTRPIADPELAEAWIQLQREWDHRWGKKKR